MRVLIVEDDPVNRRALGALLQRRFGAEVADAANGVEAVAAIGRERPDVVVLDVFLPLLDGPEVLRAVRAQPASATLPVIVMTAGAEPVVVRKMIALGVTDILIKPVLGEQAIARLSAALTRATGRSFTPEGEPPPATPASGAARVEGSPA